MGQIYLRPHHVETLRKYRREPWTCEDVKELYDPKQQRKAIELYKFLVNNPETEVLIRPGDDNICQAGGGCEWLSHCNNGDKGRIASEDNDALSNLGIEIGRLYKIRYLLDI